MTKKTKKQETVTAYKGFDANMQCRGFQFAVGETYTHDGPVKACESGFHSCEYPLDVFSYYPPAGTRFATVEAVGDISRHGDDSKLASQSITIKAQLSLAGLIKAAIEYTTSRCNPVDPGSPASATGDYSAASATGTRGAASATGHQGAASATGTRGAASATGHQGAASATGDYSAASATGTRGAASATGHQGAASATGDYSAASATGKHAVACGLGYNNRAMAGKTGAIVLVRRVDDGSITHIRASKVGENGIDPGVWYTLDEHGEFQRADGQ